MYSVGNCVQGKDGRIGTVIEARLIRSAVYPQYQQVLIRFPDGSSLNGAANDFKLVRQRVLESAGRC
ncbi:hypothetical protein IQ268_30340 [Oculatella sp. LEGE 06141]|uniref:hypothetical protein n=1 Tax=Oculatella sp. LEGE 06141 TaxID=1828648 RepID=UPI0018820D7D|nr:hypothetical protein [Oculatella sp. LEGE 06141]MBE9182840.1 hypothetical protein [Oculatella sp. LEGE 06141]